jgi:mRNA-degrading endonuclease RelE of RelBE toxin-antitoxin system
MKSSINEDFRKAFARLPKQIQQQARQAYQKFQASPEHPGLYFKKIRASRGIYAIRITKGYRALGVLKDDEITWFWIGSHADYDQMLKGMWR